MDKKSSDKNTIEFNQLLDYLKRKDINNYSEQELKLLSELFSKSGYDINLSKYKNTNKKIIKN